MSDITPDLAVNPPAVEYASPPGDNASRRRSSASLLRFLDRLTFGSALGGALVMVGLLVLLLIVVGYGAMPAIQKFGWSFLWTSRWSVGKAQFGVLPFIYGTMTTSLIALVISIPISLGCAIFLTKLAPKLRIPIPNFHRNSDAQLIWISPRFIVTITSFLIELLAAIPSIAYGLWGMFVLVPFMQSTLQPALIKYLGPLPLIGPFFQDSGSPNNIFAAGLILAIMVVPIMTAIIRDVLSAAPPELEQGALGLGATWWQATRLVLGYSKMGILGAVILGFARAIGETMAVTMIVGGAPDIGRNVLAPGDTIAAKLAAQFRNADTDAEIHALIYAAFVLLIITTLINGVARVMVMRVSTAKRRK